MSEAVEVQQPAKIDIAKAMPLTAAWVKDRRRDWGNAYVTDILRRALAGERNCFYAIEAGHIIGTPFDWTEKGQFVVSMSILTGAKFVAGILGKDNVVTLQIGTPAGSKQ